MPFYIRIIAKVAVIIFRCIKHSAVNHGVLVNVEFLLWFINWEILSLLYKQNKYV